MPAGCFAALNEIIAWTQTSSSQSCRTDSTHSCQNMSSVLQTLSPLRPHKQHTDRGAHLANHHTARLASLRVLQLLLDLLLLLLVEYTIVHRKLTDHGADLLHFSILRVHYRVAQKQSDLLKAICDASIDGLKDHNAMAHVLQGLCQCLLQLLVGFISEHLGQITPSCCQLAGQTWESWTKAIEVNLQHIHGQTTDGQKNII